MTTVGYWCDECRVKYVQHLCKDGLPCRHDKDEAVYVWAKHFAKSGEAVRLRVYGETVQLWIHKKPKDKKRVLYSDWQTRYLHTHLVNVAEQESLLAEQESLLMDWLISQDEKIIRAFLNRWGGCKRPPYWRELAMAKERE
jgi:hypothetical protein